MNISTVTFDCWGTLIDDQCMEDHAEARLAALCGASEMDAEAARALLDRAWRVHHAAWVRGEQFGSVGIASHCAAELGLDADVEADLCRAFEEAARLGAVEALPGAVETLRNLKEAGIATALVCDTGFTPGRIVRDFLADAGLLPCLDFCAFSNEVGVPKPNGEIFLTALDAVDGRPETSVHVGDLIRTDVAGARGIGMLTVRMTAVNDDAVTGFSWGRDRPDDVTELPDADEVVSSHAELPDALRRLGARL